MSYKVLFALNAIVVFAVGLVLLFAPTKGLAQFNMDARIPEVFFAKDGDAAAQRNLGMASLAGSVLVLIVTLMGVTSRIIRLNGWIPIVAFVLFALAYAFMLFFKPKMKE